MECKTEAFKPVPEVFDQLAELRCDTKTCMHHGQFCACYEPKHPPTRLEEQVAQLKERLAAIQDTCMAEPSQTVAKTGEHDVDEHLAARLRKKITGPVTSASQGAGPRRVLPTTTSKRTTPVQPVKVCRKARPPGTAYSIEGKHYKRKIQVYSFESLVTDSRIDTQDRGFRPGFPAQSAPRKFRTSVDKPSTFTGFGRPAAYDADSGKMKALQKEIQKTSALEDPERTLAELASKLQSSQAELDSKLMKLDADNEFNERKEREREELLRLANELRAMQTELKSQFVLSAKRQAKFSKAVRLKMGRWDCLRAISCRNSNYLQAGPHGPQQGRSFKNIFRRNPQQKNLMPGLRQVMQHASETYTAPDSKTLFERDEQHATESSSVIAKAAAVLAVANQRRKNLESNMAALERAQQDRSMFNVLEQISKDPGHQNLVTCLGTVAAVSNKTVRHLLREKRILADSACNRCILEYCKRFYILIVQDA
ncbi:hypothetical protein CLF_101650 [Clonorchis sinensis]|uniref:Uncharacterized protein n=1 Tax=Clonorchis sinensis TaxID=79923 RepID=G7Y684_CLOSI|nr:hypothetical protein CLF_101650 [Clonorchis sinensis]